MRANKNSFAPTEGVEPLDPPKFKNIDMLQIKRFGFTLAEVLITLGIIGMRQ